MERSITSRCVPSSDARRVARRGRPGLIAFAWLAIANSFAESPAPLVPLPARISPGEGAFSLGPATAVSVPQGDAEAANAGRYFVEQVAKLRGLRLALRGGDSTRSAGAESGQSGDSARSAGAQSGAGTARSDASVRSAGAQSGAGAGQSVGTGEPVVTFERAAGHGAEGYRLEIAPGGVRIAATSGAGMFYGAVTLSQLVPVGSGGAVRVPAQVIQDAPAYAWRGMMLDSARHFQSPEFVRSMIDWMALHKLNVLHWHLTDDQGWRIEIRKYPRLAEVGACRVPATAGEKRPAPYCGFYTQAQVRDIVAYAATRHVQVVPEIEMPGHAQAPIAAYPELGALSGAAPPVSSSWGVHSYLFNVEPSTFTVLENVLSEVMELFPGRYIHVGGDEAVKDQWKASANVQARAAALGITDPEALQTWFMQQIGRFLERNGRRLVGWDEILQPGLPSNAMVMSWRGVAGAHAAAVAGNDTVLSPWPTLYFDNRQSALPSEPPGRMRVISLEDVYRFEPRDSTLTEAQQKHVLGLQGNVWTEHIRTEERVQLMALPRAAAVAEVGWTSRERRNWADFLQRLAPTFARYRAMGVTYSDSVFAVDGRVEQAGAEMRVALANQARFGDIRYTTDGTEPTVRSRAYSVPLQLPSRAQQLRAATFVGDERVSSVWSRKLDAAALARRSSRELDLCSEGIPLLLEPDAFGEGERPLFAIDIMNPCWIYRGVDLARGARLVASVGRLPFNFELGADAQKIRVGDARSVQGDLEIRTGGCDGSPAATLPLPSMPADKLVVPLPEVRLPAQPGRHDVCLRFARPRLDPIWAIDWVDIRP
jgi:hexosaminidase